MMPYVRVCAVEGVVFVRGQIDWVRRCQSVSLLVGEKDWLNPERHQYLQREVLSRRVGEQEQKIATHDAENRRGDEMEEEDRPHRNVEEMGLQRRGLRKKG